MRHAWLRTGLGFGAVGAPVLSLLFSAPANAATISSSYISSVAPIAIAAGAIGFGLAAGVLLIRARQRDRTQNERAYHQIAHLRAELDQTQAILEGMPEVTVRWSDLRTAPMVFGRPAAILPPETAADALLDFSRWMLAEDAELLRLYLSRLRSAGETFDITLNANDGRKLRACGRAVGGASVLRLRLASVQPDGTADARVDTDQAARLFTRLDVPAVVWTRPKDHVAINAAAEALMAELGARELFSPAEREAHEKALTAAGGTTVMRGVAYGGRSFDIALTSLADGSMACLVPVAQEAEPAPEPVRVPVATEEDIGAVIDALDRPVAVFDDHMHLVRANRAYAQFWDIEANYLKPGTSEQAMLDRLRTKGHLPAEVDYRAWRTEHLKSYALSAPRETLWHLPDGRAVNVSAMPISAGGVIYVFNDLTERLALETRYNALNKVQNETLNALNEGVAVFGTNGRLTLCNPRLSILWKLPTNVTGKHPHIDEIASACDEAMPEDGAAIWANLKEVVVDLNPARPDHQGRIRRADGRLIDWAAVRLPDGQTMLTFTDVTESANYQQVLKERNDALVTADRLKDAFVQNVSYEFRSPLTNIIGFADILASGGAGELNERQKAYTDYIRASSSTLGVLIDNILDLATVDAGIAQLDLKPQSIPALIEKARSGLAATLAVGDDSAPLNLDVEIDDDLPEFIADGTRIVQILYNLLSSAARYSEEGSVVHLKVSARGADRILFVIEDEGISFPDDVRETLTQRIDTPSAEVRQRGAGLGLTIVRTFVHLHGGSLQVEDRPEGGTRITVNLPSETVAEESGAAE